MATTQEQGSGSKVHLTLHVPKGRTRQMRKLLKPCLRPADPALSLLHIHEWPSPILRSDLRPRQGPDVPQYSVGPESLSTPALSLMPFLPEDGTLEGARERLRSFPWKFHHRIELQSPSPMPAGADPSAGAGVGGGGGGGAVSGKQEFYSLSRQYPLCALCPSPSVGACTVRFNLFVRNFRSMLEFYRLLTDSEMESSKSDFALFTVNTSDQEFSSFTSSLRRASFSSSLTSLTSCSSSLSSSSSSLTLSNKSKAKKASSPSPSSSLSSPSSLLSPSASSQQSSRLSLSSSSPSSSSSLRLSCCVQLALKHCPYLEPYPQSSAYLTFFVRNMTALRTVLPGPAVETSPNSYVVRDPDGNCVLVHDVEPAFVLDRPVTRHHRNRCRNRKHVTTGSDPAAGNNHDHITSSASKSSSSSKGSSCCESQDSGRFSDSERGSSEMDQCLERLVREISLTITDYSESSDTDSDQLDLDLCDGSSRVGCGVGDGGGVRGGDNCENDDVCGGGGGGGESKIKIGGLCTIHHEKTKKKVVYL